MTIKTSVVGLGAMGGNHLRLLAELPDTELVGATDASPQTAEAMQKRFRVPTFTDVREMFDTTKPDLVVVAVPTALHKEVALEAFKRKIHVLVEKPIAFSVEEGQAMIQAARAAGVLLGVGHIERFNPAILELKRHIDSGMLGKIIMIHAKRQSPYPLRIVDVGVGMDLATHELDMMLYITGSRVVHMGAEVSAVRKERAREDVIFGLLRFESGALGILDVNWLTPTTVREIAITGERGMFTVNYHTQELCFYENPAAKEFPDITNWETERQFFVEAGNMTKFQMPRREPLRSELEAFIGAVRDKRPAPVSGEDGLRALRLALQIVGRGNAVTKIVDDR